MAGIYEFIQQKTGMSLAVSEQLVVQGVSKSMMEQTNWLFQGHSMRQDKTLSLDAQIFGGAFDILQ